MRDGTGAVPYDGIVNPVGATPCGRPLTLLPFLLHLHTFINLIILVYRIYIFG